MKGRKWATRLAAALAVLAGGDAEQGHDTIAQRAIDDASEPSHRIGHGTHGRVELVHCGFGIERLDQLRRSADVREQHGYVFALPFG